MKKTQIYRRRGVEIWKRVVCFFLGIALALVLLPGHARAVQAVYSTQTLVYNGTAISLDAYNIGGYTYFRLRDLAALLSGSIYRFSLETDEEARRVNAVRFQKSTDTLTAPGKDFSRSCTESTWRLTVDKTGVDCAVFNIGGNNFYRLRDLAAAVGFSVGYDAENARVLIYAELVSGPEAAEETCFEALTALYTNGDAEAGIFMLAQAAKAGSARAAYELAQGYYYGDFGLPRSDTRAAQYAEAAAAGGNPRGQYLYGLLLWSGRGVKQDRTQAFACFVQAAQAGHIQAQAMTAVCCYEGDAVPQDYAHASALAKAAADFGSARAAYTYGQCLYHGRGVARDYIAAAQYFTSAAQDGLPEAVHALGVCYYEGTGVRFNPYIALYYFELAAEMGYGPAAYNAGVCYATGTGTQADAEKAMGYMRLAAEAGVAQAAQWLESQK